MRPGPDLMASAVPPTFARPSRHGLVMDDGWTMPFSCYAPLEPRAVAIFLPGLGVDGGVYTLLAMAIAQTGVLVVLPSLRPDADPVTGLMDLGDVERHTRDLDALVDLAGRMWPGLPLAIGAHSVACSLVIRRLHLLQARAERIFLIGPDRAAQAASARRSLWDLFAGRRRHAAGVRCADLGQRLLASRLPMFVALADAGEASPTAAVASSLHWDRASGTARTVVSFTGADRLGILRSVLFPLTEWLDQWTSAAGRCHAG